CSAVPTTARLYTRSLHDALPISAEGCDDERPDLRGEAVELPRCFNAVQPRHLDIQEADVDRVVCGAPFHDRCHRLGSRAHLNGDVDVAFEPQQRGHRPAHEGLVVGKEDLYHAPFLRSILSCHQHTSTWVPPPARAPISSTPPDASTRSRAPRSAVPATPSTPRPSSATTSRSAVISTQHICAPE